MVFCQPPYTNTAIVLIAGQLYVLKLIFLALSSMGKFSNNPVNWAAIDTRFHIVLSTFSTHNKAVWQHLFTELVVSSMLINQVLFQVVMDNGSFVFFHAISPHVGYGAVYTPSIILLNLCMIERDALPK